MQQRQAFTLVELSIVLVILGLLVGGVLTGQSLIRAAELRSVSTDFSKYQTAIYAFKDKYLAFPGKMTNATAFWGRSAACPTQAGTAGSPGTCNSISLTLNMDGADSVWMWQQLGLAGMIEGTYYGMNPPPSNIYPGIFGPKGKLGSSYYGMPVMADGSFTAGIGPPIVNNNGSTPASFSILIALGTDAPDTSGSGAVGCWGCGGVLTNEDAWNIDTKMDDGIAASGKLMANMYDSSFGAPIGFNTYNLSDKTSRAPLAYLIN